MMLMSRQPLLTISGVMSVLGGVLAALPLLGVHLSVDQQNGILQIAAVALPLLVGVLAWFHVTPVYDPRTVPQDAPVPLPAEQPSSVWTWTGLNQFAENTGGTTSATQTSSATNPSYPPTAPDPPEDFPHTGF